MAFGNGVNLQPSYYNNGDVDFAWDLMKLHSQIETVRIEIEPDRAIQARGWIQQACANGFEVIATYHKYKALGKSDRSELNAAARWWADNYVNLLSAPAIYGFKKSDTLAQIAAKYYNDPGKVDLLMRANGMTAKSKPPRQGQQLLVPAQSRAFAVNVMNEWGAHDLTAADFTEAYNAAIAIIRKIYAGTLIVDAPGYAQETAVAASAAKGFNTGNRGIADTNVVFSVHVYREAYVNQKRGSSHARHGALDPADLDDLASCARLCMLGEFGPGESGHTDWSSVVDHAKSLGWPILGWAWNGDGKSMNMVSPPWTANPNPPFSVPSSYFRTIVEKL